MKVFFHTLGCKVNQYESQEMREQLKKNGYEITEDESQADVFVINSCTVTSESDRKTRQCVRHYKKNHPESITVLTGCLPQSFPDAAKELNEADIVLGNRSNGRLTAALNEYFISGHRVLGLAQHESGEPLISSGISDFEERTRAIVKIEDGCDRFCSYCIIPKARGRVRSKDIEDIKNEVNLLAENGYREIVLVGINLSAYGKGSDLDLADAVFATAENEKIERVRLGSLEPDHLTDGLLEKLSRCEKLCPQFHISLQSGCDRVLKKMNRHYTAAEYAELAEKLRKNFDDCSLTTDIMVGFPQETEDDFLDTVNFAEKIGFEKIHIFPYSRRSGTPADKMDGQIEKSVKARRAAELADAAERIRQDFFKNQIGKTVSVLIEGKQKNGKAFGYTPNYTPVQIDGNVDIRMIVDVKITDFDKEFCIGHINESHR
ncbi:MAG: tRNA (N(6)-L-threonylcarbamoyladenosine(37)-C(2))-methylthiotransferase MtaB [Oscillospiraceae bacterium]|nr:tRNA (N(6)-L-threonylcarbamoyladenosine(37)-C(2))-methylthiotransferase MtaB [Oscillospiraceae bacterium]